MSESERECGVGRGRGLGVSAAGVCAGSASDPCGGDVVREWVLGLGMVLGGCWVPIVESRVGGPGKRGWVSVRLSGGRFGVVEWRWLARGKKELGRERESVWDVDVWSWFVWLAGRSRTFCEGI